MIAGIVYMLVPPGRPRMYAKCVGAVVVIVAALLRIYLGIDHFTDALFGMLVGVSIPVALFRAWVPNDVYPVQYGRQGKSAHLDVSGRRGEAITLAMKEQLGYEVLSMKPVGLEGSGGSTPLKMRVVDDEGVERSIFAKLYAKNHVRADRWYKLGRTMLYGRLEDETPFGTVRRFVEYEDYTLRLLGEKGFSTPEPLDIVEITPEREYLIAMEFFEDAVEISEAEVDDQIIDDGLQLIRKMWDIGLAAPRHQARQPDGAGRAAPADRRVLRAGAAVAVAPGGRPRQHDARARPALGSRARLRAGARLLHARGAVRGVRRDPGRGQPVAAASIDEGGRSRAARDVPRARAGPQAHRDPAMERPPGAADRRRGAADVPDRVDGRSRCSSPRAARSGTRTAAPAGRCS